MGNRKSYSVSLFSSTSLSVVNRNSFLSNIKNGVLIVNSLSDRSGESFGEDLRFSSDSSYNNFWLSGDVLSDNSWFKFDYLGFTLLGLLRGGLGPLIDGLVIVSCKFVYLFGNDGC